MPLDGYPTPKQVPPMQPEQIAANISYVRPLSRRGVGPGIVVLLPDDPSAIPGDIEHGVPSVRMKWAEEGYSVVEVRGAAWENGNSDPLAIAIGTLASREECQPKGKLGLVCYDVHQWEKASSVSRELKDHFVGAVLYAESASYADYAAHATVPTLFHLTGQLEVRATRDPDRTVHEYASLRSRHFAMPFNKDFHYASESVAHSRNLSFLKPRMGGPYFDLEAVWDEHTYYEFGDRSVENVMATMVQEPYVNHVPTITGGIGREELTAFYRDYFIFSNPRDSELELISRTVGIDRVVDEFVFKATFDKPINWLLPGVPPTYKPIEVPMTVVVNVRGDRLYHEHINWDSATALRQVGALPQTATLSVNVPTPANGEVTNGNATGEKRYEIQLPIADGTDAVKKMRDKNAVESNQMLSNPIRET